MFYGYKITVGGLPMKDVSTCGNCSELETCPTVRVILENDQEALENLKR